MGFGVTLKVSGDFACFTRPEMKAERVSYDIMTPSAARGILEAIYWKPGMRWVIRRIGVLKPIRFMNLRRNEVSEKLSTAKIKGARERGDRLEIFIEEDRQQRASMLLVDVAYLIQAEFVVLDERKGPAAKHLAIFTRRATRGQCFYQPFLGCREFPAAFELVAHPERETLTRGGVTRDLGWMLHDLDFGPTITPHFFRAAIVNGMVEVPPLPSGEDTP